MKRLVLISFALLALTSFAWSDQVKMAVTGQKQGKFKSTQKDGTFILRAISVPNSQPLDTGSGMATGKASHRPVTLRLDAGPVAEMFFFAFQTDEMLTEIMIKDMAGNAMGEESIRLLITLKNARVTGCNFVLADEEGTGSAKISRSYVEVTLVAQTQEWSAAANNPLG